MCNCNIHFNSETTSVRKSHPELSINQAEIEIAYITAFYTYTKATKPWLYNIAVCLSVTMQVSTKSKLNTPLLLRPAFSHGHFRARRQSCQSPLEVLVECMAGSGECVASGNFGLSEPALVPVPS